VRIYALWDTGRAAAPDLVRRCLDRWEALNPTHELVMLDRAALEAALADAPAAVRELPIQGASNVLRTQLLAAHGGVWTDATVLPTLPLDDWLPELLEPAGFFAFRKPGPARPLSSWFLAAKPGSAIPPRILREIHAYWDRPRTRGPYLPASPLARLGLRLRAPAHFRWRRAFMRDPAWSVRPDGGRDSDLFPYHWFHYLVGWLIESEPAFRTAWEAMPVRAAIAVHNAQRARVEDGLTPAEFRQAVPQLLRTGPVQKLNWRMDWPEETFAPVDPCRVAI
jgi:hypothetical protein